MKENYTLTTVVGIKRKVGIEVAIIRSTKGEEEEGFEVAKLVG